MIRARDLRREFGRRAALAGVSLDVAPGEVVALLGPNGAGKSTLLSILAGTLRASGGSADVAGLRIPGDEARLGARVGYVPQGESVYPELTVRENLAYFARVNGAKARLSLLDEVGLASRARERAGSLSGGLRQRLALACSLAHQPQVLLLDEPGTGLDPAARERLADIIRRERQRGRAVLLSTHSLEEAARVADRVVLLVAGRVRETLPGARAAELEPLFREAEAEAA